MKSLASIAVLTGLSATLVRAATPIELTEPCDLAKISPVYQQHVDCNVDTLTPFTLSADTDWMVSTYALRVLGGRTYFDFSAGDGHKLTVKSFNINSETTPYVEFKGGTLDGQSSSQGGKVELGLNNRSHDRTIVFNGTVVTNFHDICGLNGRNGTLVITNGASLSAGSIHVYGEMTDATYTNNLIYIAKDSAFVTSGTDPWEVSGPGSSALMNNRMIVDGGRFKGSNPYADFAFAQSSSGNELIARNGGKLEWYSVSVGGSENSKSNTLMVTGAGSKVEGGGSLSIGTAVGADYNRVVIADGADLKTQNYNGTTVGSKGSYNELVISNATLSRTYWVRAGASAGANHNRVKLYGTGSIWTQSSALYMFGAGQQNEWIFDNGSFWPSSTCYVKMSEASGLDDAFKNEASCISVGLA